MSAEGDGSRPAGGSTAPESRVLDRHVRGRQTRRRKKRHPTRRRPQNAANPSDGCLSRACSPVWRSHRSNRHSSPGRRPSAETSVAAARTTAALHADRRVGRPVCPRRAPFVARAAAVCPALSARRILPKSRPSRRARSASRPIPTYRRSRDHDRSSRPARLPARREALALGALSEVRLRR